TWLPVYAPPASALETAPSVVVTVSRANGVAPLIVYVAAVPSAATAPGSAAGMPAYATAFTARPACAPATIDPSAGRASRAWTTQNAFDGYGAATSNRSRIRPSSLLVTGKVRLKDCPAGLLNPESGTERTSPVAGSMIDTRTPFQLF